MSDSTTVPFSREEDSRSEFGGTFVGGDVLRSLSPVEPVHTATAGGASTFSSARPGDSGTFTAHAGIGGARSGASVPVGVSGVVRSAPSPAKGWGRGPIQPDPRKYRYDTNQARVRGPLQFSATKVDRLSAAQAGDMLHRVHEMYGLDREAEERIAAFDNALWFEHTINGASMLQPGRGVLQVAEQEFDIAPIKQLLGEDQRRFYRAFADDIAAMIRSVLSDYDAYDMRLAEMAGQIRQVAAERGLQKYPHLAHDSSDACTQISYEERMAIMASKRLVIGATVNSVDKLPPKVDPK